MAAYLAERGNASNPRQMRIAIVTNDGNESPFKNGSVTQPLMMCLAFEKANIGFDIYAQKAGRYFNYDAAPLSKLFETKGKGYKAVLMVCHIKCFGESKELEEMSKNTRLVHVLCGHHVLFTIEDIVFKHNRCADMLVNKYVKETWIFDMHAEFKQVYEQWLDSKVYVYPYVWNNIIVDTHLRESKTMPPKQVAFQPHLPLTVVIAEPSLNITKSCFLPLVAVNAYARLFPERIRRVIVLCKPSGVGFDAFRHHLEDINQKLELHERLVWTGVACQLMARDDTVPVLLSHQHHNECNFLTLETFYLGMPVIHNAKAFRPGGFFYDGWQAHGIHDQLTRVWNGERNEDLSRSILARYAPENPEVIEGFKQLLDQV